MTTFAVTNGLGPAVSACRDSILTVLRATGMSAGELRRLNRTDVKLTAEGLEISVTGAERRPSRVLLITDPATIKAHRMWIRWRLTCPLPAYFVTRSGRRMGLNHIFALTRGWALLPSPEPNVRESQAV
jgi:integrase